MEEKEIKDENEKTQQFIVEVFKKFNIEVEPVYYTVAASYTQYILNLDSNYKLSSILKKADKIAAEFPVENVRITAPFENVAALGVEIPNKERRVVDFKDMGQDIISFNGELPMGIGETEDGSSLVFDLAEAPHVFISGNPKSGKTTLIYSMICSLLFFRKSSFVKFIMIQTEGEDLIRYNGIPHLVCPVVKDIDTAFEVLESVCEEIEKRMDLLSSSKEYSIVRYNKNHIDKIPYYVVIVDEISGIVQANSKRFDNLVKRITAVGRFVGIHLIFTTQYSSALVISTTVWSNTPTKMVFKVDNTISSRVALGFAGAEKLLGEGDMLYVKRFSDYQPIRVQGAYIGEHDVDCIVSIVDKIEETI